MWKLSKRGTTNYPEGSEDHSVKRGTQDYVSHLYVSHTDQCRAQPDGYYMLPSGPSHFVLSLLPGLWASVPCRRLGGMVPLTHSLPLQSSALTQRFVGIPRVAEHNLRSWSQIS